MCTAGHNERFCLDCCCNKLCRVAYSIVTDVSGAVLWLRYKKRYLTWGVVGLFVLILGGAGIFFLKPDSAMGRLFMWKITCKAIVEHPWGVREGFVYAYGEAQEKYFGSGDYAVWEERVAGVRNMLSMNIWSWR